MCKLKINKRLNNKYTVIQLSLYRVMRKYLASFVRICCQRLHGSRWIVAVGLIYVTSGWSNELTGKEEAAGRKAAFALNDQIGSKSVCRQSGQIPNGSQVISTVSHVRTKSEQICSNQMAKYLAVFFVLFCFCLYICVCGQEIPPANRLRGRNPIGWNS